MTINWCKRCGLEIKSNSLYCLDCERDLRKLSKLAKKNNLETPAPFIDIPEDSTPDTFGENSGINSGRFSGRKK